MTTVKLNMAGFRELRNSPAVVEDLRSRAERIRAAAGYEGYAVHAQPGRRRARAAVVTATPEAMADNQRSNALVRALAAGRG